MTTSAGDTLRGPINLALQGGGAHGAFTWGVLDRLLEDDGVAIGWLSGTSAGALNAVALASGLATGGRAKAREILSDVWTGVSKAAEPDLLRLNPFLRGMSKSASVPNMTGLISPYQFNPLGFDPLRKLLNAHIDFAAIRDNAAFDLMVAATDVATGRAKLFRRNELTVDMVLASACLPAIHHAVEIDGQHYWDGGFSANPDIVTLAAQSPLSDTLIVQLNPRHHREMPKKAPDISARADAITFNQPLLRDIDAVLAAREAGKERGWFAGREDATARLANHRFHLIAGGRHIAGLAHDTKIKPDDATLSYLHKAGRRVAAEWLERHGDDIGKRDTAGFETTK